MVQPLVEQLLQTTLQDLFGPIDPALMQQLRPRMQVLHLAGGEVLMRQHEPADSIYLVLSGRLRASREDADGHEQVLGEIGRGEPIGEMGIIQREARSARITALRDCVLMRLAARDFEDLLQTWPGIALPLARKLTERLQRSNTRGDSGQRIVNLCILPLHPGLNALALGQTLCARLSRQIDAGPDAPVALLDPERVAGLLGLDVTRLGEETTPEHPRLLLWLEQQELGHRLQIWVARAEDCPWTRLCLRHADQVLLAADADSSPEPSLVERRYLQPDSTPRPAQSLWLLHPTDRTIPRGTAAWLAARPQLDSARFSHFHTRRQHQGDWDRLARILSGRATGLVFAGGGARGFAQLGVMQALEEQGREWDMVAGTSIGAVMAAYAGMDLNCDRLIRLAGQAFSRNPTGDFNWLPLFSLFRGKRLARVIRDAVQAAVGAPIDIEDLWKPYFCVASNFSRGEMQVLRRGNLASCITASVSIPALLPPVLWQGELLTDGGSFNNYPVDLMRQAGASQVIGVSMSRKVSEPLPFSRLPGLGEILFDRLFRPRARQKYRALPHMAGMLIHVAAMSSACHEKRMQADVDLGFTPDVSAIGTLDWSAFDRVVAIGREHARAVLTSRSTPPG